MNRAQRFFLVEQNAKITLSIANRAYVIETGTIVLSGEAQEVMQSDSVKKAYLGRLIMYVKSRMTANPITVSSETSVADAYELLLKHKVCRLPVVRQR